jgi:hypothetical protein
MNGRSQYHIRDVKFISFYLVFLGFVNHALFGEAALVVSDGDAAVVLSEAETFKIPLASMSK